MTEPKPPQPIADDIPTSVAWKLARRIYIRCGRQSQLNTELIGLNATWNREQRALWVGSGKLTQVLPLIRAHIQRIATAQQTKAAGRWVNIPYDATNIRAKAGELDGVFDGERKLWAMPTAEAQDEVSAMLGAWHQARDAERAEKRAALAAARQQEKAAATTADAARPRQAAGDATAAVIARSGRTVLDGQRGTVSGRLYGRMTRAQAETAKPQPGQVFRLKDGQRALVLSCTATFYSEDAIDDGFTPDLSDEPGWYYTYQYAPVTPTDEETETDRIEAAELADEQTLAKLFRDVAAAAEPAEVGPGMPPVPTGRTIERLSGSVQLFLDGRITVTADGQVWWYHPGYYDDYRAVQGHVRDEALTARALAALESGSRERGPYKVTA